LLAWPSLSHGRILPLVVDIFFKDIPQFSGVGDVGWSLYSNLRLKFETFQGSNYLGKFRFVSYGGYGTIELGDLRRIRPSFCVS